MACGLWESFTIVFSLYIRAPPYAWPIEKMVDPIISCILGRLIDSNVIWQFYMWMLQVTFCFPNAWQCKCHTRGERRAHDDYWIAHCCWHFLCWMLLNCGLEICKICFQNLWLVIFVLIHHLWAWFFNGFSLSFATHFSGGCTWENPEVQGRKIYPREVTDYCTDVCGCTFNIWSDVNFIVE